ncbi:MAG: hypothetical protein QW728_05960, partial [Thermoplasmata archaeon]
FSIISILSYLLQHVPHFEVGGFDASKILVYFIAAGGMVSSAAVTASVASLAASGNMSLELATQIAVLGCSLSTLTKNYYIYSGSRELFQKAWKTVTLLGSIGIVFFVFYVIWL